ncbi:dolichol-phosphate mannosyltransferase [Plectosphaerella cucumerina]|uniref:Dolichol-phosphate mannosyltransferase n=1 Tax=Plectosphaerella cucumerina TaxID=40658 RepID=A0A8K0X051_9PEZI|nr:dolichol-phosphate mannosyltransferase [Plectosphaerella cucumerina]
MPYTCTVHPFDSPTQGSCAYEIGKSGARNAIIFVGGLGDGPHTVPFVRPLAEHLASAGLDYSVFEIRIRSSFTGFGYSSLANDVEDISSLVAYLREQGKQKIVLMGHSTGSQDCIEYATNKEQPVDGFILQGPVSDREGAANFLDADVLRDSCKLAADMIAEGKGQWMLRPEQVGHCFDPINAYRWHSLISKGGDDDYFSSDLDEETVSKFWNRFEKPALALYSAEDEHVPASVDRQALVDSWKRLGAHVHPLSDLIPGASHTVKEPAAQQWLNDRVARFLADV